MNVTRKLRTLIEAPEILAMPGIFDGYSVRLVEQAGFPAGFISGAGLSEALLGQPDVGLMGLETNVNACRSTSAFIVLTSPVPPSRDLSPDPHHPVHVRPDAFALDAVDMDGNRGPGAGITEPVDLVKP